MATTLPPLRSVVDHDGAVILDIPGNTMTTLNRAGAYVWQRLAQGLPLPTIIALLAQETGMDEAVVTADVETFLEELKSKHLFPKQ